MNVLSLFDGMSCGRIALERAGIKVDNYYSSEIDKYAIQIANKNYPQDEANRLGDVTTIKASDLPKIDLLIGGSPCQSLSIVKSQTRQHLDGKSKLFFEFVRAKEELKPKWFLFENVASMNEESKNVISELLGCEPIFIDSKDFSAQQRPRYYWTNIPVDMNYSKNTSILADILETNVADKYFYKHPLINVDLTKQVCATMVFKNHDMNKRVFNPAFKVHTLTTCGGGNTQKKVYINGKARKLTPLEYERLQTLPDNYTAGFADGHRYTCCGNGWTVDVIAHIFKGLTETGQG